MYANCVLLLMLQTPNEPLQVLYGHCETQIHISFPQQPILKGVVLSRKVIIFTYQQGIVFFI